MVEKVRGLSRAERRRAQTHVALITIAFVLFWVPVLIFAKIADDVAEREPLHADAVIQAAAHGSQTPALTNIFLFITAIGEPLVVSAVGLAIVIFLLRKRLYRAVLMLISGVGGAALANVLLKLIFTRARPTEFRSIITETSYSFPSGHSMVSFAFVFTLILLLWHTKYRIPAIILGGIATLLIGISRVYLGVHYPSDVVAGWSVGAIWVAIVGSLVLNRPFPLGRRLGRIFHHEG